MSKPNNYIRVTIHGRSLVQSELKKYERPHRCRIVGTWCFNDRNSIERRRALFMATSTHASVMHGTGRHAEKVTIEAWHRPEHAGADENWRLVGEINPRRVANGSMMATEMLRELVQ